jgi:anti-sigma factor RsiW
MNCHQLVEAVTEYLEGTMSPDERAQVERHLETCDGCAAYLDQVRETIRLTGRLTEDALPQEARESLLQAFRASRSS